MKINDFRYDSQNSHFTQSESSENMEENKELERMIHQSYIRRSTGFDGNNTTMANNIAT